MCAVCGAEIGSAGGAAVAYHRRKRAGRRRDRPENEESV